MNDDWRLQIDPADGDSGASEGQAQPLMERLDSGDLEHELNDAFHERVIVSREGETVYLYAGTREQIDRAREALEKIAADHKWAVSVALSRWHTESEEWEDPDEPLPSSDEEREAEREERAETERREVAAGGEPEYEVRVDLPSHRDAVRFEEHLQAEGLPAVRRWKYLVLGASDEDSGAELVTRLKEEAPPGSTVTLEPNARLAYEDRPPNPFAIFGGLGG